MKQDMRNELLRFGFLAALLLAVGCHRGLKGMQVDLKPDDPRTIHSIQVGDADEIELLVQQLGIEVVRVEDHIVYFFEDPDQLKRLADLGYELQQQNPYNVYRRVVRIDRSIDERSLAEMGVRIINRETEYLVVEATIGQLGALLRAVSRFVAVGGHEPRPRQIRIVVRDPQNVAKIGAQFSLSI